MRSFAENTDVKSFESRFRWLRKTKFNYKYTLILKKIKLSTILFKKRDPYNLALLALHRYLPLLFGRQCINLG